jgi:hypothetical protein
MGQGQAAAAGDAVAAHDAGAFADVTFPLKGSDPFWNGLAQQKVVALGPLGYPQSYYERNAPYWYTGSPTGTQGAQWTANLACQRLQGMPAIFAGDPLAQRTTRVFGLVTPENPQYIAVANEIEAGMKACGAKLARRATYSINVATFQTQSTSIVAQMKTAGVTTLFCYCDPLVPIFLSRAADEQAYHPEWTEPYYRDPQGRILSQSQWAHAVSAQGLATPRTKSEAYKVFKLANPTAEPREQYFDVAYGTVLILFNALQAAGPALTPAAFERGFHSLPASLSFGDFGGWQYGPKAFSPAFTNTLGYWDPNLKSPYDGKQGGWQNCGEKVVAYTDPATFGTPHTQLHCFGK